MKLHFTAYRQANRVAYFQFIPLINHDYANLPRYENQLIPQICLDLLVEIFKTKISPSIYLVSVR